MKQFYSLKDVAGVLKIQPYRVVYLLTTNKVPEPKRIGGKRIFTLYDLRRIAKQMGIENVEQLLDQQRRADVE